MFNEKNKKTNTLSLIEEVRAKKTIYDEHKVGEVLGGFTGFLQHSKPAKGLDGKNGMMANIFGENGDDADVITALNLTKFQNVAVKVSIWSIKDQNGMLLKDKDGKPPMICQFIGRIHRPNSSMNGLTARLFGEIGGNADAVNELNKTEFQNSLVFVQIQLAEEGALLNEIETEQPDLSEEIYKLTPKELKALEKKQKKYEDADNILVMQNFYGKIINLVGTEEEFKEWLNKQPCIFDEKIKGEAYSIIKTPAVYNYVSVSKQSQDKLQTGGFENILDITSYLLQWNRKQMIDFVRGRLKDILGIPEQYHLDPNALYKWAVDKNVHKLIPLNYNGFLN